MQPLLEDLADMFGVVVHAEAAADEAGHAAGGPEWVGPAVLVGPLEQEALELAEVVLREPWGGAGLGLGVQPRWGSGHASPAVDGGLVDAQDAGDGGGRLPLVDQVHRTTPPAFQFSCCSDGSCHTLLYGCPDTQTSFAHAGFSRRRPKMSCTWSGRPMSRFSRM